MSEKAPAPGELLPIINQIEQDDRPREECGVFAMLDSSNPDILEDTLSGLAELQHRGEDAAGIAAFSLDMPQGYMHRGLGKVAEVFTQGGKQLANFPPGVFLTTAQVRYGTDKGNTNPEDGPQPRKAGSFYFSHNGQFTNIAQLAEKYNVPHYTTDTDGAAHIIDKVAKDLCGNDVERAVARTLPEFEGAFSFTMITDTGKMIAAKDRHAVRPLHLGRTKTGGWIVASEVRAITHIDGAEWVREVEAGEMLVIEDSKEPRSGQWAKPDLATCLLEYLYMSNKENVINGHLVSDVRKEFGRLLYAEYQAQLDDMKAADERYREFQNGFDDTMIDAIFAEIIESFKDETAAEPDLKNLAASPEQIVVPIPNGGNQAAIGFAEASGKPLVKAFEKNPDYEEARSFLQNNDELRQLVASLKLDLYGERVKDKHNLAVDDSLVRGNTFRVNSKKLRDAGARIIELLIAAPPMVDTCEFGVDIGEKQELIYARHDGDIEAICEDLGIDRLVYLPIQAITNVLGKTVCLKCVGGPGPSPIPEQISTRDRIEQYAAAAPA